jgi:hypothetical protein
MVCVFYFEMTHKYLKQYIRVTPNRYDIREWLLLKSSNYVVKS